MKFSNIPCQDCITYVICLNQFREEYVPYLAFSFKTIEPLLNKCSLLLHWRCENGPVVYSYNKANQRIYDYFKGQMRCNC